MSEFIIFAREALPDLLHGTTITFKLTITSLLLGFIVGLPASVVRVYGGKKAQMAVAFYINIFRGTPLLVQLFLVYYGLPGLGVTFSRTVAAVLTLGLNSSAYQAEYFRGAIQAVGLGQMTAARAIGMSKLKAVRYIMLPQAFKLVLPAWSNEMIAMIKYTAVVFLIAVPDLMGQAKIISSRTFDPISTYILTAIIYLVMVGIATFALRILSRYLETPGLAMDAAMR